MKLFPSIFLFTYLATWGYFSIAWTTPQILLQRKINILSYNFNFRKKGSGESLIYETEEVDLAKHLLGFNGGYL